MAERDIWLNQEDSSGKYVQRLVQPTASKGAVVTDSSGVPTWKAASASIADATESLSVVTSKLNLVLAALRDKNIIGT